MACYRRIVLILVLSVIAVAASARTLDVAVGWTKPPYVIAESHSGFELDLIRHIFKTLGHEVSFIYVPYGRSFAMLKNGQVDLALSVSDRIDIARQQLSDVYITYQNVAISLKQNQIKLTEMRDLEPYAIVAFQNASVNLGDEFERVAALSPLYIELPEQKRQVEMLLLGNADVVVMDINIFNHLAKLITGKSQIDKVDIHTLFPASQYRAGFNDRDLKKAFNLALQDVLNSQAYQVLLAQYDFSQLFAAQQAKPQLPHH